jgi:Bacterial SH3 domain
MPKLKRLLVASFVLAVLSSPSIAGDGPCMVTDPTGTPLNVRSRPNGQILGALHNDTQVVIMSSAVVGGKRWVRILPEAGKQGWVFGDYVSCD